MMAWIALLGRRDRPTDGVEDYCTFLGQALEWHNFKLELVRVAWDEKGWIGAFKRLRRQSVSWRGQWVLLQYTALSWSRRGFPLLALATLRTLRRSGARVAVVFHEPFRQVESSPRWVDRLRGACQDWVISRLHAGADRCVFADPLAKIGWLPRDDKKSVFIPIGANIPESTSAREGDAERNGVTKKVAIFGVTEYPVHEREHEVADVSHAVRAAVTSGVKVEVVFVGRGTAEASDTIGRAFRGLPAEVSTLGLLSADDVSQRLAESDAMLFVRGRVHSRRGSVMAGVASGLPIVGYGGSVESTPLGEAGMELVRYGDKDALGVALTRVLTDADLRKTLREKSVCAQRKYFSWDAIARAFIRSLGGEVSGADDEN
jgi:glycosyltransferase involved in cell wall biosynthesis